MIERLLILAGLAVLVATAALYDPRAGLGALGFALIFTGGASRTTTAAPGAARQE